MCYIKRHKHRFIHIYIYIPCTYVHTYIYTSINTYIHTCMHACIYMFTIYMSWSLKKSSLWNFILLFNLIHVHLLQVVGKLSQLHAGVLKIHHGCLYHWLWVSCRRKYLAACSVIPCLVQMMILSPAKRREETKTKKIQMTPKLGIMPIYTTFIVISPHIIDTFFESFGSEWIIYTYPSYRLESHLAIDFISFHIRLSKDPKTHSKCWDKASY